MNNKGFTLIELLGVFVIMGVLSGVAIAAYSRYQSQAVNQAYDTMSQSAATAAEEYFMAGNSGNEVDLKTLVENEYLSPTKDPKAKTENCTGKVTMSTKNKATNGVLEEKEYKVEIRCKNYNSCKVYPGGTKCS